ncbi:MULTISPECIES: hypothetical protein [unclassified Microcoleus]|uniref:hypothetical protein n=1 Tax=unclassified Microcoleus TaxID=2642155 RepID=UPI002FD58F8F
MPPNLKKSGSNSSGASQSSEGFSAPRKPSENAATQRGLNFTAERELGSAGGIKATGKLTVGVDGLIGQQGVTIEADAANKTLGVGVNVGSARGKLGVNIGGKIRHDERGNISIRGAEAGINIGGFGGSASIDEDKGIRGSISVAGAKVEVGVEPDGKKTLSVCYGVPGGELCVTFEPDDPSPLQLAEPVPKPPPNGYGIGYPSEEIIPLLSDNKCYHLVVLWHIASYAIYSWDIVHKNALKFIRDSLPNEAYGGGVWTQQTPLFYSTLQAIPYGRTPAFIDYHEPPDPNGSNNPSSLNYNKFSANFKAWGLLDGGPQIILSPQSFQYFDGLLPPFMLTGTGAYLKQYIANSRPANQIWDISAYEIACVNSGSGTGLPRHITPTVTPPALPSSQLPNYPQHIKPMDCCEEIKEIHRFLGIGKFKKKKFAIANQFLAPGATGNTECADYYELEEAKIRMMANGLILNPVSSPNGTPWQTVNATAWAAQMYEMMAESMSDGNQTQKVEIALMMQLSQMMKVIAEMKREIEFLSQCIGITPELDTEDLPICFTIFQGHKGFGKKDKKLIDITSQKTDAQVEMTLTEMLQPSKIPITVRRFKPDSISIIEALRQI